MLMGIMGHLVSLHGRHCGLSAARPLTRNADLGDINTRNYYFRCLDNRRYLPCNHVHCWPSVHL